jgi:hypothetical protein
VQCQQNVLHRLSGILWGIFVFLLYLKPDALWGKLNLEGKRKNGDYTFLICRL